MSLREKLAERPVLMEFIPPHRRAGGRRVAKFLDRYVQPALERIEIDAYNIPEIVDENFRGEPFYRNVDPRDFAREARASCGDLDCVVSKVVVHCRGGRRELAEWTATTLKDYRIQNVVVVGAYLPDVEYPGPGVLEANEVLRRGGLTVGNIMIPERQGEAQKMLGKTLGGADFFTTQAVFAGERFVEVLEGYYAQCSEHDIPPAAVFVSFTPVSERYDVEFLRWLGVDIDDATERRLLADEEEGLAPESIELAVENWRMIQSVANRHKGANLGLNVEYIHRHNFEATLEMAEKLVKEA